MARLQDLDRKKSFFKSGIGVTMKLMRPRPEEGGAMEACRTQLRQRIFRDVDSLAAARSEVLGLTLRVKELEHSLQQAKPRQRELLADRQGAEEPGGGARAARARSGEGGSLA